MQLLNCPLEGCRVHCNVIFARAETPFCWRTWCQGIFSVFGIAHRGHSQSNPTNKVCVDTEFLLSDISGNKELTFCSVCCSDYPKKIRSCPKGEFSFSENALTPLRMCTAAFPTSCSFALGGERTEPQKHPKPRGCETGQEIVLFCRINS